MTFPHSSDRFTDREQHWLAGRLRNASQRSCANRPVSGGVRPRIEPSHALLDRLVNGVHRGAVQQLEEGPRECPMPDLVGPCVGARCSPSSY